MRVLACSANSAKTLNALQYTNMYQDAPNQADTGVYKGATRVIQIWGKSGVKVGQKYSENLP